MNPDLVKKGVRRTENMSAMDHVPGKWILKNEGPLHRGIATRRAHCTRKPLLKCCNCTLVAGKFHERLLTGKEHLKGSLSPK